ncbi:hypothetical protein D3C76_953630 [compost metagenome]
MSGLAGWSFCLWATGCGVYVHRDQCQRVLEALKRSRPHCELLSGQLLLQKYPSHVLYLWERVHPRTPAKPVPSSAPFRPTGMILAESPAPSAVVFRRPHPLLAQCETQGRFPSATVLSAPGNACGSGHRHRSSRGVGARTWAGLPGLAA